MTQQNVPQKAPVTAKSPTPRSAGEWRPPLMEALTCAIDAIGAAAKAVGAVQRLNMLGSDTKEVEGILAVLDKAWDDLSQVALNALSGCNGAPWSPYGHSVGELFNHVKPKPSAASPAVASIPVGTLVKDSINDTSAIIIAGFVGKDGNEVYVYRTAEGNVGFQGGDELEWDKSTAAPATASSSPTPAPLPSGGYNEALWYIQLADKACGQNEEWAGTDDAITTARDDIDFQFHTLKKCLAELQNDYLNVMAETDGKGLKKRDHKISAAYELHSHLEAIMLRVEEHGLGGLSNHEMKRVTTAMRVGTELLWGLAKAEETPVQPAQ